jgi:hypothetical protein
MSAASMLWPLTLLVLVCVLGVVALIACRRILR